MGLNPIVQMAFGCAPLYIRLAAFLSSVNPSVSWWQSVSQRHLRTADKSSASAATSSQPCWQHRRHAVAVGLALASWSRDLILPSHRVFLLKLLLASLAERHEPVPQEWSTLSFGIDSQLAGIIGHRHVSSSSCRGYLDGGSFANIVSTVTVGAIGSSRQLSLARGSSASWRWRHVASPGRRSHPSNRRIRGSISGGPQARSYAVAETFPRTFLDSPRVDERVVRRLAPVVTSFEASLRDGPRYSGHTYPCRRRRVSTARDSGENGAGGIPTRFDSLSMPQVGEKVILLYHIISPTFSLRAVHAGYSILRFPIVSAWSETDKQREDTYTCAP